jgi:effector-binding domain-containing protein
MNAAQEKPLPLTLESEPVQFPAMHYVFIEKQGSIPANAGLAWTELHANIPAISEHNHVTGYMSLYKMDEGIYRAGVALDADPQQLPAGLSYEEFSGGKYTRFVLIGPFTELQPATAQATKTIRDIGAPLRDDFNIEHYVTDPRTTPEDQLLTHILFPIK